MDQTTVPQTTEVKADIHTLNDVQKLAGSINWLRPYLGLTNDPLKPLFQLLEGDNDLLAP
ncbi:POK18 protein, partial [Herpetotheres cachinnans]|nr:POK18 protein [Herpetotheres cachinnans]